MKRFLLFFVFLFPSAYWGGLQVVQAQDQAIFSQYYLTPILVNPSVAGFSEDHNLTFHVRNQWTGFPGSPFSYAANYEGPIGKTLGVGLNVLSDNAASLSRLRIQLNYAFRYELKDVKLAGGFSTDFQTVRISKTALNNPFYQPGDDVIDTYSSGVKVFDAALGLSMRYRDKTYVGLVFPNLVVARLNNIETNGGEGGFFKSVIFHFGHELEVSNYNLTLEPSVLVRKLIGVPFAMDFNLKAGFLDKRLVTGVSYQAGLGGAIGILLGTELPSVRFYYSYNLSFQPFQQYSAGSHEVTVGFYLRKK